MVLSGDRAVLAFVVAVLGLGIVGCVGGPVKTSQEAVAEKQVMAEAAEVAVTEAGSNTGQLALDFTLLLDGNPVPLSALRGQKAVVLDFFATWCPPCRAGIPHFVEFRNKYASDELLILGVNLRETNDKVQAFAAEFGINYTVLMDTQGALGELYAVQGIPTYIGIDKRGVIVHRDHSMPADLDAFVEKLTK